MSITERIVESLGQLRSLLSQKEKIMSDQTVIEPTTTSAPDATALSPAESFANEVAAPVASTSDTSAATSVVASPDGAADVASQSSAEPVAATDATSQPTDAPVVEADIALPSSVAPATATNATPQLSAAPAVATDAASQSASAVQQDISASVKDFTQAFNFVEQGVEKLGVAAKDELIALARKYL